MLFSYRKRKYTNFAKELESLSCDVVDGVKLTSFGSKGIYFFMFPQITYISFTSIHLRNTIKNNMFGSFGLSRTHRIHIQRAVHLYIDQ